MRAEDLERIRRSLAMSPSLPAPAGHELLDEVTRLRGHLVGLVDDLDGLIDALTSVQRTAAEAAGTHPGRST